LKVRFSDEALSDLQQIGDYIAEDNPRRARTFVAELVQKAREIAQTPEGFQLVPRYEHHGIRRRVHGRYLIFYRIKGRQIAVLHIRDGAQDYEALLFPDG